MYAKLFSSIITSSLWTEDNSTKVLFITMLALADREGYVYGSANGIARVACLTPEETKTGIAVLSSPDPNSSDSTRNPENNGRRIEPIDGGWKIINYPYYRDLHDADERRHQDKMRKRKSRSVTRGHDPSRSVTKCPPSEVDSEAYSEVNAETEPYRAGGGVKRGFLKPEALASLGRGRSEPPNPEIEKVAELTRRYGHPLPPAAIAELDEWKLQMGKGPED